MPRIDAQKTWIIIAFIAVGCASSPTDEILRGSLDLSPFGSDKLAGRDDEKSARIAVGKRASTFSPAVAPYLSQLRAKGWSEVASTDVSVTLRGAGAGCFKITDLVVVTADRPSDPNLLHQIQFAPGPCP